MYFETEIVDFIELMQRSVPDANSVFLTGNCGPFSLILSKAFPGGEIKEIQTTGHLIYEYGKEWYDITGKIGVDFMEINGIKYADAKEIFSEYGPGKALVLLRSNFKKY